MKRLLVVVLLAITLFFTNKHSVFAQKIINANDSFYHLSMPGGLDQNSINQIIEDSSGQMWFATKDGLIRYNGKKQFVYKSDADNIHSIGHDFVTALLVDTNNRLWVGTLKGLSIYRIETDDFELFFPNIFSKENIRSIKIDAKGNIWILNSSQNQLYKYESVNDKLIKVIDNDLIDDKGKIKMEYLLVDDERVFLINKNTGFVEYFVNDKRFKRFDFKENVFYSGFIKDHNKKNILWFTTHEGYFFSYNLENHQQNKYQINRELTNYDLRCYQSGILEDRENNIWVTTWFYGTFKLSPDRKTIYHYLPDKNDHNAISNSITTAPYQDKAGYLWFGAEYNGVDILKKNKKFFVIPDAGDANATLPTKHFLTMSKDNQNRVWLGAEGGLYYFDKQTLINTDITNSLLKGAKRFFKIYYDFDNQLWFGTENGLYQYNLTNKEIIHFPYEKDNYQGIRERFISEIFQDKNDNIWIGYFHKGISRYNLKNKKFYHFMPDDRDPNSLSYGYVNSIFEDKEHTIWIGTPDGLNRFNQEAGNFTIFKNDKNNPQSIGSSVITSLIELNGVLWIATKGGGLNRFDSKTNTFKKYTKKDGLPSNNIEALLLDDHDNIWFSTTKNIVKFNPKDEQFTVYTESDGLENRVYILNMGWQDLQFSENFAHKDKEGYLYFGGSSGIVIFHPDRLPQNNYKANLIIESIKTNGKEIPIFADRVLLQPNENQLEIDFTLLNLIQPEKNKYSWMLKPFDSIWKQSSKISKAKYFNLKHGEYQLYYKAANNDGVWTNVSKPLTIIVLPKFYQTKWFYLLVTLFVLLIFFGFLIYRWYLKRKHKRQKKLLRYKTSSLADDKAKLINSKLISLLQKKPIYLESDLSLYSLADQLQVKPHYLSQVINQYHQRNFQDFINLYRVKKAKELLIKTQLKIEAIAYDSGFNSISTFYTAFKKEMGTTPASYRKKNCE